MEISFIIMHFGKLATGDMPAFITTNNLAAVLTNGIVDLHHLRCGGNLNSNVFSGGKLLNRLTCSFIIASGYRYNIKCVFPW